MQTVLTLLAPGAIKPFEHKLSERALGQGTCSGVAHKDAAAKVEQQTSSIPKVAPIMLVVNWPIKLCVMG